MYHLCLVLWWTCSLKTDSRKIMPFYPVNVFTFCRNKFIVVLMFICLMAADDSWLNLTDQDLEDLRGHAIEIQRSALKETGEFAGENTVKSSVSTYKSARYTVEFLLPYSSSSGSSSSSYTVSPDWRPPLRFNKRTNNRNNGP